MSGLAVLIPIAVAMGLLALTAFFWALRSGQYEDLDGASERIFEDDERASRHGPSKREG
ncbi:cytochrome C oxidase Cbb3 [Devosia sp. Root413D1]|uniref:cbb3-type cytochrome oxidase assembly protein CcoS n=1 Tax=Devosia sp. Root413D1 TaxID=1736531 RepID=UPI0006F595C4|nr:cbb3-type cytochrome oxidase assembly protein CcoS [Devosia sp. Root413D1]KQW75597.1 cytochrome C oxidase Cbb3 [Devosia sp. Root413D1]